MCAFEQSKKGMKFVMLRIKDLREDRDLLQKDVAKFLNISQTNYSKYELGKINIPINTLKKLALFFNTSIDYLLGLTDEQKPYPIKKKIKAN